MSRKFDIGRQSEVLYNEELHKLYEVMKNIIDNPENTDIGPITDREGALWLDKANNNKDLKYYDSGAWNLLFEDRFKITGEMLETKEPSNPVTGQLWLNDGVLMYYNNIQWTPVKAVTVDHDFNISAFEKFLLLNPLYPVGDPIIDKEGLKSQFVIPSEELDRFFVDGTLRTDYDTVHKSAIQYPTENIQGKETSAIHVNPSKLIGVEKKLLKINRETKFIGVDEMNTEYYAFRFGDTLADGSEIAKDKSGEPLYKEAGGKLLLKNVSGETEYESVTGGIRLSDDIVNSYDFIMSISYRFGVTKNEGSLYRGNVKLGSGTNSIYIGQIKDDLSIFTHGVYLHEHDDNYIYDIETGYLNLFLEDRIEEVSIIAFPKKEVGLISQVDPVSKYGKVTINKTYNKPLVLVYGEALNEGVDYVYDEDDSKVIHIKDSIEGMSYAILETDGVHAGEDMYVKEGYVSSDLSIPCSLEELPAEHYPILFVDGVKVSKGDTKRNSDNSITARGIKEGQQFILLKDPNGRIIFDDIISQTTIPTPLIDESLVYINNELIPDSSAVNTGSLPKVGVNGEIKLLLGQYVDTWHIFNENSLKWEAINPEEDNSLIEILNESTQAYFTGERAVNITKDFGDAECTYYAYSYANSVEKELLVGTIRTNDTDTIYKLDFKHAYPMRKNAMSVWLDGVRQYPEESKDDGNIKEIDTNRIALGEVVDDANLMYVIERPERNEKQSCRRQILTSKNRIPGTVNTYETKVSMMPGNVRVFVSGYRQPHDAYKLLDPHTIMFKEPLIGGYDNFPTEDFISEDGSIVTINRTVEDQILIEVREDYTLKETIVPINGPHTKEFYVSSDNISKEMLESRDAIMIYINGAAYSGGYRKDPIRECIILDDENVIEMLARGLNGEHSVENKSNIIIFEWR